MDQFYVFVIRNDVWLYIVSILGLVWYVMKLWQARRILKGAMFGLERERGQRLRNRALVLVILCISIISLVTYVNLEVSPTLPAELLRPPTPTPNIFATPLSSPTPQNPAGVPPSPVLAPTATLPDQSGSESSPAGIEPPLVETIVPTPTGTLSVQIGDCPTNAQITSPPSGAFTDGALTIFGTAESEDFGRYDIEAYGPQTGEVWLSILSDGGQSEVLDGILASVDLSTWLPGTYFIQLQLFDSVGEQSEQCTIEIIIG